MLSYRHAFHAGNFADVLKHLVLCRILSHLVKKDKPFCAIDTHAGAGVYSLSSAAAQKNREYVGGIARLWSATDLPPVLADYVDLVKAANDGGKLNAYPGSPSFIRDYLRADDRAFCYERHTNEARALEAFAETDKRIRAFAGDGLASTLALLPPRERRGLVLIDPSFEVKEDYREVPRALGEFHKRFQTGIYALWYPIIRRDPPRALLKAIAKGPYKQVQCFELQVRRLDPDQGMTGCGMVVINPPWTLEAEMATALPSLAETLGVDGQGTYRSETLIAE